MSENPNDNPHPEPGSAEAWREVGQQFQALGRSLAAAFRSTVDEEGNRQRMHSMQSGLEAMVADINQAIRDASASPQGQQVRSDVEKAAAGLRSAGEQTYQEVRPQLLTALKQVTRELEKLADRMDKPAGGDPPPAA